MSRNIGCALSVDVFSSEIIPYDWIVLTSLPALQLTKLHQLAMQHIPFTSLGQSNPTFPGTYPKDPWGTFSLPLSLCPFFLHLCLGCFFYIFLFFLSLSSTQLYPSPSVFFSVYVNNHYQSCYACLFFSKRKANLCPSKSQECMYISLAETISHDLRNFFLLIIMS